MMIGKAERQRLQFLSRVIERECHHLLTTDQRLFTSPFTTDRAVALAANTDESERVDAFVTRFGRLQDTIGDKVMPLYLQALGERTGAVVDNLDRGEKLGLIPSSDQWLAIRKLRNRMVHEYIEDAGMLSDALQAGHEFVAVLRAVADQLLSDMQRRGLLDGGS